MTRIVLYFPKQANPAHGVEAGRDLLPLSLLTIAGLPVREGYDVVLIDGNLYDDAEAERRVLEACDDALLYGTTGILGYQVTDAYRMTRAVHGKHPKLAADGADAGGECGSQSRQRHTARRQAIDREGLCPWRCRSGTHRR